MAITTEVRSTAAGAVVVKVAQGRDVERLRSLADRLRAASHPGVVQVLESTGTEEEWELRLAHAGRPARLIGPITAHQVAGLAAALAATLADLHANGVVHGRIDSSHVLVAGHGRPVLCGFDLAADCTPADDVAGVGHLIVELLGSDPEPTSATGRARGLDRIRTARVRRALLALADQACAEPASRRPSAVRLAASLATIAPATPPDVTPQPRPADPVSDAPGSFDEGAAPQHLARTDRAGDARRARLHALLLAILGVLVLAALALRLVDPAPANPLPTPQTATTPAPQPVERRPRAAPGSNRCPQRVAPAPCPSITVVGTEVRVEDQRYEVGRPGDEVVIGDWDCDGTLTPAVLRPSSGEVFIFPGWAQHLEVAASDRITDASAVTVEAGPLGCDQLVVERADGTRHVVNPGSRA